MARPLLNCRLETSDPAMYVEFTLVRQLDGIESCVSLDTDAIARVEILALRPIRIAARLVMTFRNRQRAQSLRTPSMLGRVDEVRRLLMVDCITTWRFRKRGECLNPASNRSGRVDHAGEAGFSAQKVSDFNFVDRLADGKG
jgi:hypothetical protein